MFNIQGFLTCKSKLPDELQTPQPNQDLESYESPAHRHRDCTAARTQHVNDQSRAASQMQAFVYTAPSRPVSWHTHALNRVEMPEPFHLG